MSNVEFGFDLISINYIDELFFIHVTIAQS